RDPDLRHLHSFPTRRSSDLGDDPTREGVLETPGRVVDAFDELYAGYRDCPAEVLDKTFSETGAYDDFVLVKDIAFNSHCEHHMIDRKSTRLNSSHVKISYAV